MRTCPICDEPLPKGKRACPACAKGLSEPDVFEFADEDFQDFARGTPAPTDEEFQPVQRDDAERWYPELEQSPVFQLHETDIITGEVAKAGIPVLKPVTSESGAAPDTQDVPPIAVELSPRDEDSELTIVMEPLFEVASAAGGVSPTINTLFTIKPHGEPLVDASKGPIAHVILALDLSASMNHPDKYPVLTRAIGDMIRDMKKPGRDDVLLSVIVFAYGAQTLIKGVPASQLNARDVITELDHSPLRFGRYTDIVGALSRAGRIAYDFHKRDRRIPLRISVLTDGHPQDLDGAKKVMEKISKLPVDVDGLAFGDDAHVAVLQQLVSGGRGGTVKHVRAETLGEAFANIAESAQNVIAKRALLDVELRPGIVGGSAARFRPGRHSYGANAFKGGRHFQTDLGTLEAGRSYSLLFQMKLPASEHTETEIGRVTLRVPGIGGPRTFECLMSLPRHAGEKMPEREAAVVGARDILDAVDNDDTETTLRALKARRDLYVDEHRDQYVIDLIEKAIAELEEQGNLENLSNQERSALVAHTCSVGSLGKASAKPASTSA